MYRSFVKPLLDRIGGCLLLIGALPVLVPAALLLAIANRGRAFFFQERLGKEGRTFRVVKLKTMSDAVDEYGVVLPDHQRLTKIGRIIRDWSIDELPQLWNVCRGDMSLVGPRPLLSEYGPHYSQEQRRRHEVKPGLTGLAQIRGRNLLSWEEKFAWDIQYVDNFSLALDLTILWETFLIVIARRGITPSERPAMEKFSGSKPQS